MAEMHQIRTFYNPLQEQNLMNFQKFASVQLSYSKKVTFPKICHSICDNHILRVKNHPIVDDLWWFSLYMFK